MPPKAEDTVISTKIPSPTSVVAAPPEKALKYESPVVDETTNPSSPSRPWYARGGMHVNEIGMGLNLAIPVYLLWKACFASVDVEQGGIPFHRYFLYLLVLNWALAFLVHGMRTVYCVLVVPTYMTSALLVFALPDTNLNPLLILVISLLYAMWKVGVCMSVCLHRYAAHAAFKCNDVTRFGLFLIGSMANQGGPIWWASQHRAHHKYCDGEQDPHSAHQDGVEAAFSFFQVHNTVWEEFAPTHCDSFWLRLVDTWSFVAVTAEMSLAYYLFGPVGLFISFTSAWLCQSGTLWFNVANHPEDIDKPCKAADYRMKPPVNYPAFLLLDLLYPLFATVVGESNHEHHHIHFALAKRGPYDLAYYTFVWPLEKLGVVWNVKYLYTTE